MQNIDKRRLNICWLGECNLLILRLGIDIGDVPAANLNRNIGFLRGGGNLHRNLLDRLNFILVPYPETAERDRVACARVLEGRSRITEINPYQAVQEELTGLSMIFVFKEGIAAVGIAENRVGIRDIVSR